MGIGPNINRKGGSRPKQIQNRNMDIYCGQLTEVFRTPMWLPISLVEVEVLQEPRLLE